MYSHMIFTHQSSPGESTSLGRCSRGLVSPPSVWVAVPFEQELGTVQTTLRDVAKGLSMSLSRSLKELPRSLATERENEASQAKERARDTRIEDPEQRPDREDIEGTGASSSRDGAGNEPPPRPAESSVSVDQAPRAQNDDADTGDPESDRRRPRESVVEERETKRVMINVLDGEEGEEWVETEEEWVRINCRPT